MGVGAAIAQGAGSALQGIGSIYGAYEQGKANRATQRAAEQRYNTMRSYVDQYLRQGDNPYSKDIMSFLAGGSAAQVGDPSQIDYAGILNNQSFNAGQDGISQMLRRNLQYQQDPSLGSNLASIAGGDTQFDNTPLFSALKQVQQQGMNQQVAQLQGGYKSLGARLGSGAMNAEANLRSQLENNANLQNAQIAQQSFESAQNRRMGALGLMSQDQNAMNQFGLGAFQAQGGLAQALASLGLQQAGMGLNAAQFNAGQQNQFSLANQNSQNLWNQLMLSGMGQAAGIQQAQNANNAGLLGLLNGQPFVPQQPGQYGAAMGDIGSLLMLYPFIQQMMGNGGGGGGGNTNYYPSTDPTYGIPSNINWGFGH